MSNVMHGVRSGEFVLIAEIGVNHFDIARARSLSPMDAAKLMIREAHAAGAHAVKFQSYKAHTLVAESATSYWDTAEESCTSQFELFKKYDAFGEPEYRELAEFCASEGIDFMSTAFDYAAADYLNDLMDVNKISSSDLTNIPFIRYQAEQGKPVILSTGASTLEEIRAAVDTIRDAGVSEIVLMHCVLEYPTPFEHANLGRIRALAEEFPDVTIGYSDHCRVDAGHDVITAAYLLGAQVVEKHFTLDTSLPGNDHYHAMNPDDVRAIMSGVSFIRTLVGKGSIDAGDNEAAARLNARRSIFASRDIKAGEVISPDALIFKRPGTGISPANLDDVVGRTARLDIPSGAMLEAAHLDPSER